MTELLEYLNDIIDAGQKIEQYTRGMDYEDFASDQKTVDAVLRNFEVIGEAAKNVPNEIYDKYSEIPWSEMAGMRDKLIHGYATIELRIVWMTIQEEIPTLIPQVKVVQEDLTK